MKQKIKKKSGDSLVIFSIDHIYENVYIEVFPITFFSGGGGLELKLFIFYRVKNHTGEFLRVISIICIPSIKEIL